MKNGCKRNSTSEKVSLSSIQEAWKGNLNSRTLPISPETLATLKKVATSSKFLLCENRTELCESGKKLADKLNEAKTKFLAFCATLSSQREQMLDLLQLQ